MTLPNNAPPSPAIPFSITGTGSAGDGSGTTVADLATRTLEAIQAILQDEMAASPNWTASSTNVFQGITGGIPGLFISFFEGLTGLSGSTSMTTLLTDIEALPGISPVFTNLETIFGDLDPLGSSFDPADALTTLFNLITTEAADIPQLPTAIIADLPDLLTGFATDGTSILTQLPSLLTSLPITAITDLSSLFGGLDTSGSSSLLSQLISAAGGSGSSLSDFGDIFAGLAGDLTTFLNGLSTSSPLLTQLIGLFSGTAGGLSGTAGLGGIFTDIEHLLGNPTALGSGSPVLPAVGSIPILGPLLSGGEILGSLIPNLPASQITSGTFTPALLQPFIDAVSSGFGGTSGLSFSGLESFLGGLSFGGITATQVADDIFGVSGGSLTTLGTNLMSLLGGIDFTPTSGFDPVAAASQLLQEVLTPAGALSNLTQVPAHLLGNLTGIPSSILEFIPPNWVGSFNNLLPDPGFSNAGALDQSTIWSWDGTVDNTGVTGSGSATTHANSLLKELIAVPVTTAPTQTHFVGIFVKWTGLSVTGSGTVIELLANAYDATDTLLSQTPVSGIASPPASSAGYSATDAVNSLKTVSANSNNFVLLSGTFQAPAGTKFIRMATQLSTAATAGQIWLDDGMHAMQGTVDAGAIGNVESMPLLPNTNVQGIQGIADIGSSLSHTLDQFMNALNNTTSASGTTIAAVANALNDLVTTANQALSIAQTASGMVGAIATNFNAAGPATLTIPTNMQVTGRKFDLVALGGGGAGQGEYGAPVESPGGFPGSWNGVTVTYGTEIPGGTTTLSVNVGTGGAGATGYFENGTNGNPTTIKLPSGTTLLSAAGGAANSNTAGTGPGPGNYSFNGVSYPGGATVVNGSNGSAPGGGGSGALPFSTTSGNGAAGYAGIVMRTP